MPVDRGLFRRVILTDENGTIVHIDPQTLGLLVVTNEHHHIHEGYAWTISGSVTLNLGASLDFVVLPENSDWLVHCRPMARGEAEGSMTTYRNVTNTGGAVVTPQCANQDNPHTQKSAWRLGGTTTGTSTIEYFDAFGAGQTAGGTDAPHERVLKRNTKYCIRLTSDAASNEINYDIFFYEHSLTEG